MDRGAGRATVRGVTESNMSEQLYTHMRTIESCRNAGDCTTESAGA